MDDAQLSRTSDAAATRKRRSSILKSQRAPRAPLSELEFSVATPTDTAKSRRVSFSRKTGVAEFVTNEATTTWKNFYEEHNKSLESSAIESAARQPRPSVGHLGKRNFEDQFQEVEAIDFGSSLNEYKGAEGSINNVQLDQFVLECTEDDRKLSAPRQNLDFSTITVSERTSKLFADDLAISGFGEITDKITANFSTMQPIGDDLDEIQKDLERHKTNPENILCPGPPSGLDMFGYLEIDLNCTRVAPADETGSISDDMSITDTINIPKVNISKNAICGQSDKSLNKDWVADKENIPVNPYVAPKESTNFAINEEPDKILVFDGKRLTFQSEKEPITDYRKTLISSEMPDKPTQRKTIVLNVDDDLPNFIENPLKHSKNFSSNETLLGDDSDVSITQPVSAKNETKSDNRQAMVFEDSSGNISMTQALPTSIALKKRETIVFDNDTNISITQAVPTNVIISALDSSEIEVPSEKRKTLVFDDEAGNISITQALPTTMILERNDQPVPVERTVIYEADSGDISETQILPPSMPKENKERTTLVFNDEEGNISLTKAIPSNILLSEVIEQSNNMAFDVTKHTSPFKPEQEKRKTLLFSNEDGDISMTRPIPSNVFHSEEVNHQQKRGLDKTIASPSLTPLAPEKRKTIVFNDEDGNISLTTAIPSNQIIVDKVPHDTQDTENLLANYKDENKSMTNDLSSNIVSTTEHQLLDHVRCPGRKSLCFSSRPKISIAYEDYNDIDISMTEVLPSNIISAVKGKTVINDSDAENTSLTQAVPSNVILSEEKAMACNETKNMSVVEYNTGIEVELESITCEERRALQTHVIIPEITQSRLQEPKSRLEEPNSVGFIPEHNKMSNTQTAPTNFILSDKSVASEKEKITLHENNTGDVSAIAAVPENMVDEIIDTLHPTIDVSETKHETIQNTGDETTDMSMTKTENVIKSKICEVLLNLTSGLISDHEDTLDKTNSNTKTPLNATLSRSVMVYQTTNSPCVSFVKKPNLEQESVLSTISSSNGKVESEEERTDGENIVNAEYVTVSHRIPIPYTNINKEIEKIPLTDSDANILGKSGSVTQDLLNTSTICPENTSVITMNIMENESSKHSCSDISYNLIQSDSAIHEIQKNIEKSLLHDLLDMDTGSGIIDKSMMTEISGTNVEASKSKSTTNSASDDLFFITKDSDHDTQTEDESNVLKKSHLKSHLKIHLPLQTELKSEENMEVTDPIPTPNKYVDKNIVTDIKCKDFQIVENTRELMDIMLSQFTEKEGEGNPIKAIAGQCIVALDNNLGAAAERAGPPRRPLSREDLISNISMAQAALRAGPDVADSEFDSSPETTPSPPRKNVRRDSEVVKTLRFEEEDSLCDFKDDSASVLTSPLKKTAFSESSATCEESKKGHVIPTYLKDVSDGIKSLMTELVKPMVDEMPFGVNGPPRTSRELERQKSCDAQANLYTSSQIDLPEVNPYKTLKGIIKPYFEKYYEPSSESSSATEVQSTTSITSDSHAYRSRRAVEQTVPGVVKFDPTNPLNNVLFAPVNYNDAHKYDPVKKPSHEIVSVNSQENESKSTSREDISGNPSQDRLSENPSQNNHSSRRDHNVSFDLGPNDKVDAQYNIHRVIPDFLDPASLSLNKPCDNHDTVAPVIKRPTANQSVETTNSIIKDEGINTDITMQDSKRLLEHSSSLTMVNSSMRQDQSPGLKELSPQLSPHNPTTPNDSRVEMIYRQNTSKIENEIPSDELETVTKKNDKRKYKKNDQSLHEVTPKPAAKVARRSRSSAGDRCGGEEGAGTETAAEEEKAAENLEREMSGSSTTPASLPDMPAGTDVPDTDSLSSAGSCEEPGLQWRPALMHEPSSKDLLAASDSAVDVPSVLQRLPFMGSNDCTWETETDDEWSFLLLRGRLRLTVRLARKRAAGQQQSEMVVCGSTPVQEITIEQAEDVAMVYKKYAGAVLAVQYALRAMRHVVARAGARGMRAGALAGVLRGCAGVARAAERWARAMQHAWAHLAFALAPDGGLTLSVANLPQRCVWEVRMHIELRADDEHEAPCPLACEVSVANLVGAENVAPREVTRVLAAVPKDWGHVPRSLWRIFRYLKNRQVDNMFL